MLLISFSDNFAISPFKGNDAYTYYGKPILWIVLAITIIKFSYIHPRGKQRMKYKLMWMTAILAGFYIFIMMLAGVIVGFGISPYDHSFLGIIMNIFCILCTLVGREFLRAYLVTTHQVKWVFLKMAIIVILMTLANLNLDQIFKIKTNLEGVSFLGGVLLPELSNNILASYLVYLGGPVLSVIYLGLLQCFLWLSPILPNLNLVLKALIGVLCPIFSLLILQYFYSKEVKLKIGYKTKDENPFGWVITTLISVALVWFAVGVFPVKPLVIATGSMEPVIYPGDIVLSKQIEFKELKVGDVIQFKRDNIYIFHRIIEFVMENEKLKLRTKGDNNSSEDPDLVEQTAIYGKVIYTIPKIGLPTLFLRTSNSNNVDKNKLEF